MNKENINLKKLLEELQEAYDYFGDIPVIMDFISYGNDDIETRKVKDIIVNDNEITLYNWK